MKRFNRQSLNERFTLLADKISEWLGAWWFSAVSLLFLLLWTFYGVLIISQHTQNWFTSAEWNFPLNTITTCGEWLLAALCAAAANRIERRNRFILEQQTDMLTHNQGMHERQLQLLEMVERLVEQEKGEIEQIEETTNTLRSASQLKEQQANAHLE